MGSYLYRVNGKTIKATTESGETIKIAIAPYWMKPWSSWYDYENRNQVARAHRTSNERMNKLRSEGVEHIMFSEINKINVYPDIAICKLMGDEDGVFWDTPDYGVPEIGYISKVNKKYVVRSKK